MSELQWHGTEGWMKHSFIDFKFPTTNPFHPNVSSRLRNNCVNHPGEPTGRQVQDYITTLYRGEALCSGNNITKGMSGAL